LAIDSGYDVVLSNSRGPETLTDVVADLGPHATAGTAAEAAAKADIVVVSIPLRAYRDVPVEPLAGKIVIDTNNYYWQRDGHFAQLDDESTTSAGLLQEYLPESRVVKAFNHIQFSQLAAEGQPPGTADRRALVIAGDDAEAKATVTELLDGFGYDVVDAGGLAEGWRFEPGHPAYGPRFTREEMTTALAAAGHRPGQD
jgi:predicted dinucleotide-binding enzyme